MIITEKNRLMMNTGVLTASALIARVISMAFQAWMASRIGSEGIGLFQLTGAVSALFGVVAVSGIRFASTRLIDENLSDRRRVQSVIEHCFLYAAVFGTFSAAGMIFLSKSLAFLWIEDARTLLSLRIAAAAMPLIAFSSVLAGYFNACGNAWKPALISIGEQLLSVLLTIAAFRRCDPLDLERICASITGSSILASGFALILLLLIFLREKPYQTEEKQQDPPSGRLLRVALPLAVSSYIRTGLSTTEHLIIPQCLRRAGLSAEAALSGYGLVHGMALSAVLFPACLLFALAELIVPLLTKAQMNGDIQVMHRVVSKLRIGTILYAMLTASALAMLARPIAEKLYHTPEAAGYIRALAPLVPIMNLDTITDGCLRGLGQQRRVMRINILDAALGVSLVWILLPRNGVSGYLWMIWITESVNCLLSSTALQRALQKKPRLKAGVKRIRYALL